MKYNEPKTFKCKGNEKQFNINGQIIDQLEIASEQLEASKLNKVRDTLAEGMRILKERQKLILISDSDKHGWKVAEEYETHILAENKEGEKRLWKAEQRAEKRVREDSKEKVNKRRKTGLITSSLGFQPRWVYGPAIPPAGAALPLNEMSSSKRVPPRDKSRDMCHVCGMFGHWRNECSLVTSQWPQPQVSTPNLSSSNNSNVC